jgi:hypothetical protein
MPRAQLAKTAPAEIAVGNFSQWMTASGPLRHLPGKSRAFCPAPIYTPGLIPRKMPQGSWQKPRFLPADDEVMSAEIAGSNFSQIKKKPRV